MKMKGDTPQWKFYEMKRIMDKRYRNYNEKNVAQYLLRWKEYGPEWNVWRSITKLGNCMKLMKQYETKQLENQSPTFRKERSRKVKSAMKTPSSLPTTSPPQQAPSKILTNSMVIISSSGNPSIPTSIITTSTIISVNSSLRRSERLRRWSDSRSCFLFHLRYISYDLYGLMAWWLGWKLISEGAGLLFFWWHIDMDWGGFPELPVLPGWKWKFRWKWKARPGAMYLTQHFQ